MRLTRSKNSAEEELTLLLSEGYSMLQWLRSDYRSRVKGQTFSAERDNQEYTNTINKWGDLVLQALRSIFPTPLEANAFANPRSPGFTTLRDTTDETWFYLQQRTELLLVGLKEILTNDLSRYTDSPIQERLYIEDIDSFRKVRDINADAVHEHLKNGYLDISEERVQIALEKILNESMHKKDWGGEQNDLYTTNVFVNGARTATAFLLKGNGLRSKVMQIADCGKNGDQLVRLFQSSAQLFVVQFVGNISESIIADLAGKVRDLRSRNIAAHYCTINGQDTARLLYAYGSALLS